MESSIPELPEHSPLRSEILTKASQDPHGISFEAFMSLALYHPEEGYYNQVRPIGKEGDFFTSVSVGSCFGFLIARQLRQIFAAWEEPAPFTIVEQGSHSGQLMKDILTEWPEVDSRIVEPLPRLREFQCQTLQDVSADTRHVSTLRDLRAPNAVFFCNELLDAFPVRRLHFQNEQWKEWRVCQDQGDLVLRSFPLDETGFSLPSWIPEPGVEEFTLEVCPGLEGWMEDLSQAVDRGVALIIDYGLTREERLAPERCGGTMRAYRNHQPEEDLLAQVGKTDLTWQVDFTGVAELARSQGWDVLGFTDQARFLTGIAAPWLASLEGQTDHPFINQFKTLTHPGIMGRSFKVLVLAKNAGSLRLDGLQFPTQPL